jgi:LysM repeat protein
VDPVCPLLGLAGERRVVIDGADAAHRCHAEEPPGPIDRATQVQLCLTAAHERCERYTAYLARRPGTTPGRSPAGEGFVSTRLLLAAQPPWRGVAGRARRSRSTIVVGVAGAAVLGLAGVAVASSLAAAPEDTQTPTPGASAASEAASATPRSTPIVTASPQPTPSITPSPTAEPTPPPTPTAPPPTPAPPVTYTVQAGDTLVAIAQRFGTTVEALLAANDIDDPGQLRIGQVLVIP